MSKLPELQNNIQEIICEHLRGEDICNLRKTCRRFANLPYLFYIVNVDTKYIKLSVLKHLPNIRSLTATNKQDEIDYNYLSTLKLDRLIITAADINKLFAALANMTSLIDLTIYKPKSTKMLIDTHPWQNISLSRLEHLPLEKLTIYYEFLHLDVSLNQGFPNLKKLTLINWINGSIENRSHFTKLTSLEELNLGMKEDYGCRYLQYFPQIKKLTIRSSNIKSHQLNHCTRLTHLRLPYINLCEIDGVNLDIRNLTRLEYLEAPGNYFSIKGNLPNLKYIFAGYECGYKLVRQITSKNYMLECGDGASPSPGFRKHWND